MFLSKKSVISTLALSCLVVAPMSAKKPTTFLSKIGHSIIQTVNKHYYLATVGLVAANCKVLDKVMRTPQSPLEAVFDLAVFVGMTKAEWTLITAITDNFEIDPVK